MALSSDDIATKLSAKKQRRENRQEKAAEKPDYGTLGEGGLTKSGLKHYFGLKPGDSDFDEGSSTGVKGNSLLGDGYLGAKDYKRLRNDDEIWDLYAKKEGDDAMQAKRDGNPDGLSINALDGLLDWATSNKAESAPVEAEPYVPSETYSKAAEGVKEYEEFRRNPTPFSRGFMGGSELGKQIKPFSESTNFMDNYKLDLLGKMGMRGLA